jgi:hypothetical protein
MVCDCCGVREESMKDYRFIERYGFQGKTYVCDICYHLDNVTFVDIHRIYGETEEVMEEFLSIINADAWEKYGLLEYAEKEDLV